MIKIALMGSRGKMGTWISQLLATDFANQATLFASADRGDKTDALLDADVIIDFSLPEGALSLIAAAHAAGKSPALVIGSTGWKVDGRKEVEAYANTAPVLMSSNYSTGVLALLHILRGAAPLLEKLGYTPVLVETHHKHKKDSPSGTALSLQRAIAPAGPGNVQTHAIRAGEIIGDHEVSYYGAADRITLGHFAQDRSIFARGAIEAAIWIAEARMAGKCSAGLISADVFFKEKYGV